ncbi:MAG: hypothetical protein PVH26_08125, partial [Desulfosarcina sp.]
WNDPNAPSIKLNGWDRWPLSSIMVDASSVIHASYPSHFEQNPTAKSKFHDKMTTKGPFLHQDFGWFA